ncbi:hypothetical protein [Aquirufa regiilacus]|uniref:DNRLRE domain-containing protein n=1 Tax=Aquirufa regiilacus TaxID=3024868 RepID=A0ABU3TPQ4_9BACT|nr:MULTISPECIES: hypothetical protein [unclassified Aquirufa]MDT8887508.1 hypothetical protein [Aquirufa sp. LEPPI-3A]MDU0807819.1 hypothetical protein [Aquirufa sp. LEOWEIH-7C]
MKNERIVHLNLIILMGLLLFKFNAYPNELKVEIAQNSDSTKSYLLEEVKVLSDKFEIVETEQPKRKKNYSFITKAPSQIGMLFDDENLIGKRPRKLKIYFDKLSSNNYTFQILVYSLGTDSLPSALLNKQELAFSSNKIGWNELPLKLDYLTIPPNGIIFIVNFFAKSKDINEVTDRIALGRYSTKKRFFVRPTSQNEWIIFSSFHGGKIGPMMRLIAGN